MRLFYALYLAACAAATYARSTCFKCYVDAKPAQRLRFTSEQSWAQMEASCAATYPGSTLLQYVGSMTDAERAACDYTVVPYGVYHKKFSTSNEEPGTFHWTGGTMLLEPDDLTGMGYDFNGNIEEVGTINVSTGMWGFVPNDAAFKCALCQMGRTGTIKNLYSYKNLLDLDRNFASFVDFEVALVERRPGTDRIEDNTAEDFLSLEKELLKVFGFTRGKLHFSSNSTDDQGTKMLYVHLTSESLDDVLLVNDSFLGLSFGQEAKYEIRSIRHISPCPIEDYPEGYEPIVPEFLYGLEETDPKLFSIGNIQVLVDPERELLSQRECIWNQTTTSLSWSPRTYWQVLWKNCTTAEEQDEKNTVNPNLKAILARHAEKKLEKFPKVLNCTDLEALAELGNYAVEATNNVTEKVIRALSSRLSHLSLDDGVDFCLAGKSRFQVIVSDLSVDSPVVGIKLDLPKETPHPNGNSSNHRTGADPPNATIPGVRGHAEVPTIMEDLDRLPLDDIRNNENIFMTVGDDNDATLPSEVFKGLPLEDFTKGENIFQGASGQSDKTPFSEEIPRSPLEDSTNGENIFQAASGQSDEPPFSEEIHRSPLEDSTNGENIFQGASGQSDESPFSEEIHRSPLEDSTNGDNIFQGASGQSDESPFSEEIHRSPLEDSTNGENIFQGASGQSDESPFSEEIHRSPLEDSTNGDNIFQGASGQSDESPFSEEIHRSPLEDSTNGENIFQGASGQSDESPFSEEIHRSPLEDSTNGDNIFQGASGQSGETFSSEEIPRLPLADTTMGETYHAVRDDLNTTDEATELAVVVKGFDKDFQRLVIVVGSRIAYSSDGRSLTEAYERTVYIEMSNADSTLPSLDLDDDGYFIDITHPFLDETVHLHTENVHISCVAWNTLTGSWSVMACRKRKGLQDSLSVCRCRAKHMTQNGVALTGMFAIKVAIDATHEAIDSSKIDIFQYISANYVLIVFTVFECVISSLGLLSFVLTAIFNKTWRADVGHKILLHMVMALTANLVLGFLTDYVHLDTESVGCIVIGVLRHYSFLVMFLWMLVLSGLQMKRLMTVAGAKATSHLVLKVAVFAWGLPLLPIGALLAWNARIYRSDRYDRGYCYPEGIFFQVTVQGPAAFILFINLLVFIAILRHIFECCSGDKITKHSKNERAQQMRRVATSVFIFFLFGFTWVLHYLSEENVIKSDFLFEYLFLMTATTHIAVLALFFVVLDDKAREFWLEAAKGKCCFGK